MTNEPTAYALHSILQWKLNAKYVYGAFWLFCLLKDKARISNEEMELIVPHHAPGQNRFAEALKARNFAMSGMGQPMLGHVCSKCMKFYKGEDGKICKLKSASGL